MKKFILNALRRISLLLVAIWLFAMLIALIAGPFVDASDNDALIYRLEVLWMFLLPALAIIYKVNPKGVFSNLGIHFTKGIKRTMIFFLCVVVLTMSGFLIIDNKHSDNYLAMIQEKNSQADTNPDDIQSTEEPLFIETSESTIETTESESLLKVETTDTMPTEPSEPENDIIESRFVGTEGCTFDITGSFDCDGVIYEIHSVKIKADRDSESPDYNYYEIFFDLTIHNSRNEIVEWDLAYNGNLYGLLCHRGVERRLGGNSNIKDEDFSNMKLRSEGTLAPGESVQGYRSLVCMPNSVDFPKDTWPLYTDEAFDLKLHLVVNEIDYVLTIHFNQ